MASAAYLPVDLVEEIFLRLDEAADLVRASAACAAFRRVVSDGCFLRRYRSFHRPPVLGLLSRGFRFHPAEPPRQSAQAARTVARATGFSSSFLPAGRMQHCWHVHDPCGGRVLLSQCWIDNVNEDATCLSFWNLVVYDPLHRKYVQIPPIPNDLVACTCTVQHGCCCCCCDCDCEFEPFLVPAAADEDDLSFRVMCTVLSANSTVLETFVYSSVTGKWCGVASISDADYEPVHYLFLLKRHYAHCCFYWVDYSEEDMLVLDMNKMKFSVVRLPHGTNCNLKTVVKAAEEDGIGLLVLCKKKLQFYTKANDDVWQWRRDAVVTLLDSYVWYFSGGADQSYALLRGIPRDEYEPWRRPPRKKPTSAHYFTVELQTLLVEQLCVMEFDTGPALLYASFPPPFAPPSL